MLYDVASAVMYFGGRRKAAAFCSAYKDAAPASAPELIEHLDSFGRLRSAVQAAYFSMRVSTEDLTGIADRRENAKGLRDALRMLAEHGVRFT